MNTSPDKEIKKIYEKSVRLLNDKQARLMDLQQLLKKTVIRLSHASRGENEQVNTILDKINVSVDEHVDLTMLNKELDNLFVIINHGDYKPSAGTNEDFYVYLKDSLKNLGSEFEKTEYVSRLQSLVDKKIPNDEMSSQILACIKEFSQINNKHNKQIDDFIESITDSTDFTFKKSSLDTSKILQELAIGLTEYLYKLSPSIESLYTIKFVIVTEKLEVLAFNTKKLINDYYVFSSLQLFQ